MNNSHTQNNVDIWLTHLDKINDTHKADYYYLLNNEEKDRLNRFLAPDSAEQFLVARALLRTRLTNYQTDVEIDPRDWVFKYNKYGKPCVSYPSFGKYLSFNISHTQGLIACAFSETLDIGVDTENLSRELNFSKLAQHSFAPYEVELLKQYTTDNIANQFYTIWTLKEAYIKARGMGLSIPLDSFWFNYDNESIKIQFSDRCIDNVENWQFKSVNINNSHRVSLAVNATLPIAVTWHEVVPSVQADLIIKRQVV